MRRVSCALALAALVSLQLVWAHYVPYVTTYHGDERSSPPAARRQDADDDGDDMDSNASAPYQNQNEGGSGGNDGYEDADGDGPYEETPREQEGQADLERFFDDHLGASDRDGMDKENLPTNVLPVVVSPQAEVAGGTSRADHQRLPDGGGGGSPTVRTEFIRLPDEKLIITRQVTQDTSNMGRAGSGSPTGRNRQQLHRIPAPIALASGAVGGGAADEAKLNYSRLMAQRPRSSIEFNNELPDGGEQLMSSPPDGGLSARRDDADPLGGDVVVAEDEDFKRVYVTRATNKPFRIDALGGFDPEEAFDDASRDMNGPGKLVVGNRKRRHDDEQAAANSVEPDTDALWEDASNTDEITFGQDDPYQTDLEAEMRHQAYDKIGVFNAQHNNGPTARPEASPSTKQEATKSESKLEKGEDDDSDIDRDDDVDKEEQQQQQRPLASKVVERSGEHLGRRSDDEAANSNDSSSPSSNKSSKSRNDAEDEGGWAHDGVEDMDIPSQAQQNRVLEKAAKRDALARRRAEEEAAAEEAKASETPDDGEDSQRMPNADYMRADMRLPDESY